MQNFWTGNNRLVNDEELYGSAGLVISGQDWLGLGQILGSASAGTEACGARPLFAGKSRRKWDKCVEDTLKLMASKTAQTASQTASQATLGIEQLKAKKEIEKQKKNTIIVVVSLVSVAVLVAIILLIRKRKKA